MSGFGHAGVMSGEVRAMASDALSTEVRAQLRRLLWESFPDDFTEDDWQHGLGGVHVVAFDDEQPIGHASVVSRSLHVGDQRYDGGYLEAVAVDPGFRGRGAGTSVVRQVGEVIAQRYPIAALSTNEHGFYEQLGWERWLGPTYVVVGDEWRRTEDEDAGIMVLRPAGSPVRNLAARIAVDVRSGDSW